MLLLFTKRFPFSLKERKEITMNLQNNIYTFTKIIWMASRSLFDVYKDKNDKLIIWANI